MTNILRKLFYISLLFVSCSTLNSNTYSNIKDINMNKTMITTTMKKWDTEKNINILNTDSKNLCTINSCSVVLLECTLGFILNFEYDISLKKFTPSDQLCRFKILLLNNHDNIISIFNIFLITDKDNLIGKKDFIFNKPHYNEFSKTSKVKVLMLPLKWNRL